MNRADFQALSRIRIADARVLLLHRHYPGAYYLAGYAVECALKACVARQTARYDFPDKGRAEKSHTHNLEQLVGLANLKSDLDHALKSHRDFEVNWTIVKDWSERSRYESGQTRSKAADLYRAVNGRTHGVLRWLRQRW